jgi:hypothetical protein
LKSRDFEGNSSQWAKSSKVKMRLNNTNHDRPRRLPDRTFFPPQNPTHLAKMGELGCIPQGTVGSSRFAWVPMTEIGVFFGLGAVF